MRNILLLALLLTLLTPAYIQSPQQDGSSITVLAFKWSKARQAPPSTPPVATAGNTPQPAMIPQNKNYQRNVRMNNPNPNVALDPNLDTIDARSAALEKAVQDSRTTPQKVVDGYLYKAKIQNKSERTVEIVFWEYRFAEASNGVVTRRQFLCGVNVKPGKEKELQAFSLSGPSDVVSVQTLAGNPYQESVLINRVEYGDGSIWQRKGWNFGEIRLTYARAVATPWGSEMCRGL
jgi:hypothetical protein